MKLAILQEDLTHGLTIVSRSVAAKAALPILANILLTVDQGKLKLSATNLESGINLWLGAKIEKEGALTVPAKVLSEFVASLSPEKIELEAKETSLVITTPSAKATFLGTAAAEFPQIPLFSGKTTMVFPREELIKALLGVAFAAAQDEGRPVLTGVLLKEGDGEKISLVATDGYRLSIKNILLKEKNLEGSLLLPAKTLLEVSRLAQEKQEDSQEIQMVLTAEKTQAVFRLANMEFSSRLLEGEFPDFEKIIPKTQTTKAEFDKEEFSRAVKTAAIFAREQANIVKIKLDEGKMTISAETPQVGSNESEMMAKTEGEDLEIAFNCRFLLDFLNSTKGEEILFEGNGPLSPGVFKIKGDDSFLHLIMPVRLQG